MNFNELKKAEKAMMLAWERHGKQKYGNRPYFCHLVEVITVLASFGYSDNPDIICVGWLHDILEDTQTEKFELESLFGASVSYPVWALTAEEGINRMDKLQRVIPKLRSSDTALTVKLADRIANTRASLIDGNKLYKAYSRENYLLRECLYQKKKNDPLKPMWDKLIELSKKPTPEKIK